MTDTITDARPTLVLGQRVSVGEPTWSTNATDTYPYEGTLVGLYEPGRDYGSAFVIPDEPRPLNAADAAHRLATVRRENRGMALSVTFVPEDGSDEDRRGAWIGQARITPIASARVALSWDEVKALPVGTRLLVASPRPDSDPYPATILSTGEYTTRVQYDVGRPGREGVHGDRDWNLSEYPDWAAFRLDSETQAPLSASPETTPDDVQRMRDRITALEAEVIDRESRVEEAKAVLSGIGSALLDTADRSEWCDEYDRKLARLYDSLPGRYGFDDVFNEAAKRDVERSFTVEINGHVHVTALDYDSARDYVSENAERLIREAWINGCFDVGDAEEE